MPLAPLLDDYPCTVPAALALSFFCTALTTFRYTVRSLLHIFCIYFIWKGIELPIPGTEAWLYRVGARIDVSSI